MIVDLAVRYLHFVTLVVLVGAVLGQAFLLRRELPRREIARLGLLDRIYAVAVIGVLATGLAQWLWVGKPAAFYGENPIFHAKLTLFLLVGLISIYPTLWFNRQRRGDADETIAVPTALRWSVGVEIALIAAMPVLATLMARGVGLGWTG